MRSRRILSHFLLGLSGFRGFGPGGHDVGTMDANQPGRTKMIARVNETIARDEFDKSDEQNGRS
jgi:hypothetical protein